MKRNAPAATPTPEKSLRLTEGELNAMEVQLEQIKGCIVLMYSHGNLDADIGLQTAANVIEEKAAAVRDALRAAYRRAN